MSNEDNLLIDYLPPVLRDIREYQTIMQAEQPEIYKLYEEIENTLNNQFLSTLNETGVERWEKILKIIPNPTHTFEERKFAVITLLSHKLPYSMRMLEQILTDLCGEDNFNVELDENNYFLLVRLALFDNNNAEIVGLLLKKILPANLLFIVANDHVQMVHIHVLGGFLSTLTHNMPVTYVDLTDVFDDVESTIHLHTPSKQLVSKQINQKITVEI